MLPGISGTLWTALFLRPRRCSGGSCCCCGRSAFLACSDNRSSSRLCVSMPASTSSSCASFTWPVQPSVKHCTPSLLCTATLVVMELVSPIDPSVAGAAPCAALHALSASPPCSGNIIKAGLASANLLAQPAHISTSAWLVVKAVVYCF